jgi:cob(I)alamin adenosyltransferase
MSIVTKRGDDGRTDLLFGKRISKAEDRVEAIGAVDELNAALGVVRVTGDRPGLHELVDQMQMKLIALMGELAVDPSDVETYVASGLARVSEADVADLEATAARIEAEVPPPKHWVRPGAAENLVAAHLDVARTVCRRAERRVLALGEMMPNQQVVLFLNRASDVLWLLARQEELRS